MSNTARKARKAAGIKFVHPTKTATPLRLRASFDWMSPQKAMEQLVLRGTQPVVALAIRRDLVELRADRRRERRLTGRR